MKRTLTPRKQSKSIASVRTNTSSVSSIPVENHPDKITASYEFIPFGEEAFFVISHRESRVTISVRFTGNLREVLVLKQSVPEFCDISTAKLLNLCRAGTVDFGPLGWREARKIISNLKMVGLDPVLSVNVTEGGLLVDERGPHVFLIEDMNKYREVVEDAIRRGVRIVEA